jgi:hypothetical protein
MPTIRTIKGADMQQTKQPIASEDKIVHDDNIGIDRVVRAGDVIPPDLIRSYAVAPSWSKTTSGPEQAAGDDGDTDDDLNKLKRPELNELAAELGLDPGDYSTKPAVIEAIEAKRVAEDGDEAEEDEADGDKGDDGDTDE